MNTAELREELRRLGVPEDAYGLDDDYHDECYVLDATGSEWVVFYAERGLRTEERRFPSESDACADLLHRLTSAFGRES